MADGRNGQGGPHGLIELSIKFILSTRSISSTPVLTAHGQAARPRSWHVPCLLEPPALRSNSPSLPVRIMKIPGLIRAASAAGLLSLNFVWSAAAESSEPI